MISMGDIIYSYDFYNFFITHVIFRYERRSKGWMRKNTKG